MRFKAFFVISLFIVLATAFLASPAFDIKNTEISGLDLISQEDILKAAQLERYKNIFLAGSGSIKKRILENTYVEDVTVQKILPNTIVIAVTERRLSAYIEFMKGTFLYLDDNGRVIDVNTSFTQPLPVVVGLPFSHFTLGQVLEVEDQDVFDVMVTLGRLFNKYNLENDIVRVDLSNANDIHLFVNELDVQFGDISDADQKIRTLLAILENLPYQDTAKGFLDMRDISKPAVFRLLT